MLANYEKFLKVLQKWTIDASKSSKYYGKHLGSLIKTSNEECFPGDSSENLKKIDSLLRMADNKYFNKYTSLKNGATGLNLEEVSLALSEKFKEKY